MDSTHVSGLVTSSPTCWASSDRYVIIPFGRILRVYDVTTSTPRCVAYLRGHSLAVVAVVTTGDMRVASASEDGTVRVWDVSDGTCLRTIDLGQRICHMCSLNTEKLVCFGKRHIDVISLSKKNKVKTKSLFSGIAFQEGNGRVHASEDGHIVAVLSGNFLKVTSATSESPVITIKHHSCLTAVCVSHDGSMLAVGSEAGIITVYPNPTAMLSGSNKTVKLERSDVASSTLHWHSSPVRALSLTKDGTFLYSGGTEAVLLAWKMTRNHFGQKTILPRLGAPILALSLSVDESLCTLTQADNSVRIINLISNGILATIRGISASIADFNDVGTPSLVSRVSRHTVNAIRVTRIPQRDGQVIISGNGGNLQLLDIYKGDHLLDISVIPRNTVHESKRYHNSRPDPAHVKSVKIHPSGQLMATVEVQNLLPKKLEDYGSEKLLTTLRFSNVSPDNDATLTSVCARPHGVDKDLSSVCFHPHMSIAVTTSTCGTFKIWRALAAQDRRKVASWRTEVELGYKGLPCNSGCFSNDGSLLAVACGSVLTLWHVEDLLASEYNMGKKMDIIQSSGPTLSSPTSLRVELLHALVHPPAEEHLQSVRFIYKQAPLFVAATSTGIYVWNALTQGIWWSSRIRTRPETMTVDEESGYFGIAVQIPVTTFSGADDRNKRFGNHDEVVEDVPIEDIDDQERVLADSKRLSTREGSERRQGYKKGNKTHIKRMRPKASNDSFNTETGQNEAEHRLVCAMDCAIALFDAASPCPLKVLRSPTGVNIISLEFVSHSSIGKAGQPSLVCIDSKIDVGVYSTHGDEDGLSTVTASSLSSRTEDGTNSAGKLDSLLGASAMASLKEGNMHMGKDVRQALRKPKSQSLQLNNLNSISEFFDGPIHVQAPVSIKSAEFIRALRTRGAETSATSSNENSIGDSHSKVAMESGDVENTILEVPSESNYQACYDICAEILRSQMPRKKKSKTPKPTTKELSAERVEQETHPVSNDELLKQFSEKREIS